MANFEQILFGKKTFSDLLKNIYDNSSKTEKQIGELIQALKPYITNAGEAIMIVPLIKEYLDVKVKNDEQLVKMAGIVQRAINNTGAIDSSSFQLSDNELSQLMDSVNSIGTQVPMLEEKVLKRLEV
jgi:hypothetical protein